jgi:hypothetical protein
MLVPMSDSENRRFKIIQDVCDRRIRRSDAAEILNHNLSISNETLSSWMIADGLWTPHARRKPRVYQPRYRRDCLGELIQIDGSHHNWFEGRSGKCCLLVFIDGTAPLIVNHQAICSVAPFNNCCIWCY